MFLSIIIPVYNEQDLVLQVIGELAALKMPDFVHQTEIIIVNDCSTDRTKENLLKYQAQNPNSFTLLNHETNQGKGAAVRTGAAVARGDTFLVQDADLELSPADIPKMLDAMHYLRIDFINGSRYLHGVLRPLYSYRRYLANKIFTLITSVLIDVRLTDMACGYKLIKKSLWQQLNLKENRFAFEAELVIKAVKYKRNNIAEVPVHYFPRNLGDGKKFRNTDGFRILLKIFEYSFFVKSNT